MHLCKFLLFQDMKKDVDTEKSSYEEKKYKVMIFLFHKLGIRSFMKKSQIGFT